MRTRPDPEIRAKKSLREIMAWTLQVLRRWAPTLRYKLPQEAGEVELDLFGKPVDLEAGNKSGDQPDVPQFVVEIKETLEGVLRKSELAIWLMIDRLDEVFPRRSELETRALRGLLRATRLFTSQAIRIKVFLRDDMLEHVVTTEDVASPH